MVQNSCNLNVLPYACCDQEKKTKLKTYPQQEEGMLKSDIGMTVPAILIPFLSSYHTYLLRVYP